MAQKKKNERITIHEIFENNLTFLFSKTASKLKDQFVEMMEEEGLVPPHKGILTLLEKSDLYNQLLLCKELNINKTTMVRLLDTLESKKLIKRVSSNSDRRENVVNITPEGRKLLNKIKKLSLEIEDNFFINITNQDKKELIHILLKINGYKKIK